MAPVHSCGQSQSATTASTICSIDSTWSPTSGVSRSALAPSLMTAERGSTVFTRTPLPTSSAASALVIR